MYIEITMTDSGSATGGLRATEDLKRFNVLIGSGCSEEVVARWLAESGAGSFEGGDVAVSVRWLRQCTSELPGQWQDGFADMLDYASARGWMNDARTVVMAHVEKP